MSDIHLEIDGQKVEANGGETILEIADRVGIHIPRLCHDEKLKPSGNCRICVVEVEGAKALAGACHTPVANGMVIRTNTPKVVETRKVIIELLLVGHTGSCVNDTEARECGLHHLAAELEAGPPEFNMKSPRFYPPELDSQYVSRDMSKCILCRKCVRACNEIVGEKIYDVAYRGFKTKIVVDTDIPLNKPVCKDCGVCIDVCPTSALLWPANLKKTDVKISNAEETRIDNIDKDRARLFNVLKEEQRTNGHVSPEALKKIADELGLTVSEVYGVASFYSFISLDQTGKHIIRICQSLPCHMEESETLIKLLKDKLGIGPGETTADNKFTLETTNCIGACDQAPAMMINEKVFGHLTAEKINDILNSY